ncbi:cAMP-specific 3',5'-cyclic phosphodiesterase 4A-like isoform X2 [Tribolium madens]|uniref:cAMP-specific 3',5'-cyclic phosphodiesterase 4A-like isoform X2 n=1 Tax=Tribolium madens TaxID=41895 RepID=UPI001CF72260|nr:cAMP-specific 3',5'-cyclic phosphodiesterase 4A-like isoform X2 [Tribolium madens]
MMFPFSTCMCFRQNQIWTVIPQQFEDTANKKTEGVSINITDQNAMYIKMVGPVEVPTLTKCFSKEDWVLLDAMGSSPSLGCSGRFLTMHKRRRKKLTTRSLSQDHAILDDIHHGLVQRILDQVGLWGFNAFTLETVAGGRALSVLCVHLFHWYGLLDYFQLDVVRVWKLFTLIEEGYHSTNPYHNSIHATDVTQAMHCFLQEEKIRKHLSELEIMAALIGAVAHDLDHPGVNQHFLISTSNHLAILYQNTSVLENHHWRSAVGCLLESGVAEQLLPHRNKLELQIRDLILATDINRQNEFLTKFKAYLDEGSLDLTKTTDRHFILQIALKCADISNPTRPWDISHKWSLKVCDEFFRQGEFERKLNLPVTSICDQQSTSVAKIQVGFFRYVVKPLFSEWHRFLKSTLSTHMMEILEANRKRWEKQESAEQAEETQTELSDAEPDVSDDEEATKQSSETPSIMDFIPPPRREIRRQSLAVPTLEHTLGVRRHSVPVNMEPSLPRTIYRRESLPAGRAASSGRSPISPVQNESRTSSGLREEDELMKFGSQSSIISSTSPHLSSGAEDQPERPLSAENLLPEPSIASMTSSAAASRLSSVLQGNSVAPPSKCLTRQQTFPPPQPYVRMRYMSATVEMSTCTETVHEGESRSNSSHGSHENISNVPHYTIPAIAVLSPNNSRSPDFLIPEAPQSLHKSSLSGKREQEGNDKEKVCKMVKLSDPGQRYEKENVDPRRLTATSLARRRGSAPVSLPLSGPDDNVSSAGGGLCLSETQTLRRGSVPIEIAHYLYTAPDSYADENLEQVINITPVETTRSFWQYQRRGSAPIDLPPAGGERREQLTRHTSLNGKSGRRKKQLRRRSSGGPETVCLPESSHSEGCSRLLLRRPENPDALLARRRGSLPIEVLTVGHSVF